ncbi:hypothetical protein [Trichothermofontia sp.]
MTANPNFADYVERVQENLAVLSLTDAKAKAYLMESKPLATYNPRPIAFEILFNDRPEPGKIENDRPEPGKIERKFDPHVSDRLFDQASLATCLDDLKRLYRNAEKLGLDLAEVDWSVPAHIKDDEYLADKVKKSIENLSDSIRKLGSLYEQLKDLDSTSLQDEESQPPETLNKLREVKKILRYLLNRYEVQYIPTTVGSTALIYEAWKQGKLIPLGNPEKDEPKFDRLLAGLFIKATGKQYPRLLEEMAEDLGLDNPEIRTINEQNLSHGRKWIGYPEGWEWFTCVECSLVHRLDLTDPEKLEFRYLIYYPLLIDDYWFAGVALIYSDLNVDPADGDIPEVFNRRKYAKVYSTIKSVSDTLKISLREEALKQAEKKLRAGTPKEDVLFEVVRDYFVCFNVRKIGCENKSHTNVYELYADEHIQIFGPNWLKDYPEKLALIAHELNGYKAGVRQIPGLYKLVDDLANAIAKEQAEAIAEGEKRQSQKFAHQAAGLIQSVWRNPSVQTLDLPTRANLWHLNTLIQIWGNNDLEPQKKITDVDFPNWQEESITDVMENLVDFSLDHALERATFPRPNALPADTIARKQAFDILNTPEPTSALRRRLGIACPLCDWPDWVTYRGFVLCFHHAFWQATYHGFRALCGEYDPLPGTQSAYLQVWIEDNQARILNAGVPIEESALPPETGTLPRDSDFFNDINQRLSGHFKVEGPTSQGTYWITTVTKLF